MTRAALVLAVPWVLATLACERPPSFSAACAPMTACGHQCVDLTSSSEHCGACEVSCGRARCLAGACERVAVEQPSSAPVAPLVTGEEPRRRPTQTDDCDLCPLPPPSDNDRALALVAEVLFRHPAIEACAARQRSRDPGHAVRLELALTVSAAGRTQRVQVLTAGLEKSEAAACLGAALTSIAWPAGVPHGVPMTLPFKL